MYELKKSSTSNNLEQMIVSDFFISIIPLLKQKGKSVRIIFDKVVKNENLYNNIFHIIKSLKLTEYINFVENSVDDFDFFEEMIHLYISHYYEEISNLNIQEINKNLKGNTNIISIDDCNGLGQKNIISSLDSTKLIVYSFGDNNKIPIVIILPSGMPMQIMKTWIKKLMLSYYVITWETRGMFSQINISEDIGLDVENQLEDLESIFNFFRLESVHVFGVCQGANLALHACGKFKEIINSASMWHGDYNWNDDSKFTFVQKNFVQMIQIAKGLDDVSLLRGIMCNPKSIDKLLETYSIEILPNVMYPYISDKIFCNFIKLSENIISKNLLETTNKISQKVLVITSTEDQTAHPSGSIKLNSHLSNSELYIRKNGNHISFFEAPEELIEVFSGFFNSI